MQITNENATAIVILLILLILVSTVFSMMNAPPEKQPARYPARVLSFVPGLRGRLLALFRRRGNYAVLEHGIGDLLLRIRHLVVQRLKGRNEFTHARFMRFDDCGV
jgi:hypothetical protein